MKKWVKDLLFFIFLIIGLCVMGYLLPEHSKLEIKIPESDGCQPKGISLYMIS